jgi:hypothetical protein
LTDWCASDIHIHMRTMVVLNDQLHREATAYAARHGMTLAALLEEGLRIRLAAHPKPGSRTPPLPVCRAGGGLSAGLSLDHMRGVHDRMDGLS